MAATGYSETMVGYEMPYLKRRPVCVLQVAYLFQNMVRFRYVHNLSSPFFWNMVPCHWMLVNVSENSGRPETWDTNYQVTRRNMSEEQTVQLHHCERLKTRMYVLFLPTVQLHLLDFGTGKFYFIPPHPLSCYTPPPPPPTPPPSPFLPSI